MTSFFSLVIAAAEQNNRNKDYPQATIIVIKKAFDTHLISPHSLVSIYPMLRC